ncbi:MAG: hypothetical protein C3F07_07215, partial [Anaerolineales bacterium]
MHVNSKTPGGDLWLKGEKSVPVELRSTAVWGQYWLEMLQEHEEITQIWIGLVSGGPTFRWIAGTTADPMPARLSGEGLRRVITERGEFVYKDHQELVSGGLFPIISHGQVLGVVGLLSRDTDYFKPDVVGWLRTLFRAMGDGLLEAGQGLASLTWEYSIARTLISHLDVEAALPEVLEMLAGMLDADVVSALRYTPLSRRFELLATHGLTVQEVAKLKFRFDAG